MSEEFDHASEATFTSFIPLTIAFFAFIVWIGFQDYELNNQRSNLNRQFQASVPTISEAQQVNTRYINLMKDLVQTASQDDNAKAIVQDAIKAGLIHVQPNAATGSTTPATATGT